MSDNVCRVPVTAVFSCTKGERPTMVAAEYVDIPADAIARFFIERLGGEIPGMGVGR